ncbi:MAG: GIY-YIG nuclease family protein [Synergistaceae bacterium]|nr:GIY-YIG nuclease family protein [Synergistaceae bacterium]
MAYGKTIELFLVNGTANSLVIAELSNWNGKAIKIPRMEIAKSNRGDLTSAGVYFLFCKADDTGKDAVYIGEAENVKERLVQHLRDYQADKEKYYWTTAIIFIGNELNKTLIRYLENKLVELANSSKRYIVLTKNTYRNTVIKESQIAAMEEFIDNIKVLINALGYKVLEPLVIHNSQSTDDEILFIDTKTVTAKGKITSEGFVVLEGSDVSEKIADKSLSDGMRALRQKLFENGKVQNFHTTEDLLFSSSSAAADFLLGYNVSGPKTWKNKNGVSLKEIDNSNN